MYVFVMKLKFPSITDKQLYFQLISRIHWKEKLKIASQMKHKLPLKTFPLISGFHITV
jgi:hypothetical protein